MESLENCRKLAGNNVSPITGFPKTEKLMNRFDELKDLVMSLEGDFDKFYNKQNQAAGTRVRKGMQDLKVLAQDIRSQVQNMKNDSK